MKLLDRTGWIEPADPAFVTPEEAADADQPVALAVPNSLRAADLEPVQDRIALIVVDFPSFGDGRGFSLARQLRQQGFAGRLRAVGLIPDQFGFALRAGFDEVAIPDEQAARQPIGQWLAAAAHYSASYQGVGSILQRRAAA